MSDFDYKKIRECAYWQLERISDMTLGDDEMTELALTPELLRDISRSVVYQLGPSAYRKPDLYQKWLSNPDRYSPYIDSVAVSRALDFDWAVIDRLTRLERRMLVERLAEMDDPWGKESPTGNHPRLLRFLSGPERQRSSLQREVKRHRARQEAKGLVAA